MEIETWNKYINKAMETAKDQLPKDQLSQACKGLDGEWYEFKYEADDREDLYDELGDMFWYLALVWDAIQQVRERTDGYTRMNERACGLPEILAMKMDDPGEKLVRARGQMSNVVEKVADQEDPWDREKIDIVSECASTMYEALQAIFWELPSHFEVLNANIEKLNERHGGGHPAQSQSPQNKTQSSPKNDKELLEERGYKDELDKLDPGKIGGVKEPEGGES